MQSNTGNAIAVAGATFPMTLHILLRGFLHQVRFSRGSGFSNKVPKTSRKDRRSSHTLSRGIGRVKNYWRKSVGL